MFVNRIQLFWGNQCVLCLFLLYYKLFKSRYRKYLWWVTFCSGSCKWHSRTMPWTSNGRPGLIKCVEFPLKITLESEIRIFIGSQRPLSLSCIRVSLESFWPQKKKKKVKFPHAASMAFIIVSELHLAELFVCLFYWNMSPVWGKSPSLFINSHFYVSIAFGDLIATKMKRRIFEATVQDSFSSKHFNFLVQFLYSLGLKKY